MSSLRETRKEALEDFRAGAQQHVDVLVLRHALAVSGSHPRGVAFDDGDTGEVPRKRARGQQPGHAAAQHDGVSGTRGSRGRSGGHRKDDAAAFLATCVRAIGNKMAALPLTNRPAACCLW